MPEAYVLEASRPPPDIGPLWSDRGASTTANACDCRGPFAVAAENVCAIWASPNLFPNRVARAPGVLPIRRPGTRGRRRQQ